jgi:hypothetical protein
MTADPSAPQPPRVEVNISIQRQRRWPESKSIAEALVKTLKRGSARVTRLLDVLVH